LGKAYTYLRLLYPLRSEMAESKTEVKQASTDSGYAPVNGLNLYYENHGNNEKDAPLILLHGSLGTVAMFEPILAALSQHRKVIAVELQGHGHTEDIDRPLSFEAMADDVSALIKCLGLGSADLLGYSLGGLVALQTAIRNPKVVRKLVLLGSPCKSTAWYPDVLQTMAALSAETAKGWVGSPMHTAYARVAPRVDDWPNLAAKLGNLHKLDFDWSEGVSKIAKPVFIGIGDADGMRPSHAVEIFELVGGGKRDGGWDGSGMTSSRLSIFPATTHYNLLSAGGLATQVVAFLQQ